MNHSMHIDRDSIGTDLQTNVRLGRLGRCGAVVVHYIRPKACANNFSVCGGAEQLHFY